VCLSVCPSVLLSHARIVPKRLNVGSRKQCRVITQGLWFPEANSRRWATPISPEICTQSDPALFEHNDFNQYPLIAPNRQSGKKSSISTNRNSTRAFQLVIDEPCTLPLSLPMGCTKCDFLFWPVKFNICRKKSAAKFICVKTSRGKVVATSSNGP